MKDYDPDQKRLKDSVDTYVVILPAGGAIVVDGIHSVWFDTEAGILFLRDGNGKNKAGLKDWGVFYIKDEEKAIDSFVDGE